LEYTKNFFMNNYKVMYNNKNLFKQLIFKEVYISIILNILILFIFLIIIRKFQFLFHYSNFFFLLVCRLLDILRIFKRVININYLIMQ